MPPTGRLAPTPSGQLHLGNITAFAAAWLSARQAGGTLLLRIEDIDQARARAGIEADQRRVLEWLGLTWDRETARQSERDYDGAIRGLGELAYFCACTRRQLKEQGGHSRDCRAAQHQEGALRLALPDGAIEFVDRRCGAVRVDMSSLDDPVVRRRDGVVAYNLAVVADDIADGVTEVVRGDDLLQQTAAQIALWRALNAPTPTWLHAPLVAGADGNKLSKSHGAAHIDHLRAAGWEPAHIWELVLPWLGCPDARSLQHARESFDPLHAALSPIRLLTPLDGACPTPKQGVLYEVPSGGEV